MSTWQQADKPLHQRRWLWLPWSVARESISSLYHWLPPMTEDGYTSSTAWDGGDQSDLHSFGGQHHGRPSFQSLDSVDEASSTSPQPRSSSDSRSKSPASQPWRDPAAALSDRRDVLSTIPGGSPSLVEPSFDENVLRALCELDVNIFWHFTLSDITFLTCLVSVESPCFLIESNKARCLVEYVSHQMSPSFLLPIFISSGSIGILQKESSHWGWVWEAVAETCSINIWNLCIKWWESRVRVPHSGWYAVASNPSKDLSSLRGNHHCEYMKWWQRIDHGFLND
jgi:hypothetical protein